MGVFPIERLLGQQIISLPHARGGVSMPGVASPSVIRSSPRPWGCFRDSCSCERDSWVFPTPVGVFLAAHRRVRRDRSLPHARGGVSTAAVAITPEELSSPRPWGCFPALGMRASQAIVFPTPVGVFLERLYLMSIFEGLPHARGGVSCRSRYQGGSYQSSPRPWGCFRARPRSGRRQFVFPTPVGVFPSARLWPRLSWRLPHARGGVSHTS